MIRFSALGALGLESPDQRELRAVLTQPRLIALLGYLVVARPQGFHRRDALIALFWPEVDQQHARNALRQVVHRLRRELGAECIASRGAEEIGVDASLLWSDVAAFETALSENRLADALELYRGDFLPGFFLADAPGFEQWLDHERRRLHSSAAAAAARLADSHAANGHLSEAVRWARQAASMAPDDEGAARRVIELLLKAGDRSGALTTYDALERRLGQEFGVQPATATRRLVTGISDETSNAVAARPAYFDQPSLQQNTPARRRRVSLPLAAAALLTVVAVAAGARALRAPPLSDSSVKTLAVLPFGIRQDSDVQFLRDGMVDLLSAKLNGASGFRAVDPQAVIAARRGQQPTLGVTEAATIARNVGAQWMIRGDVIDIAGRLQMTATLYDVRRGERPAATATVEGESGALFKLVDDLTGRILAGIAVGRDTSLTRLSAMTTHSLPALKAFLEGEQALRAGQEPRAAAAFREAVDQDSTFALAQYRLALTATWSVVPGVTNPAVLSAAAARHAQRLTPLVRDLLAAYNAYRAFDAAEAERLYRSITQSHPAQVEAWLMLGETLFHYNPAGGRSASESRMPFERVLSLDPANPHAIIHLARLAALEGRESELDSLVARYRGRHPQAERMLEIDALRAYVRNDSAGRAEVRRRARDADDLALSGIFLAGASYAQNLDVAADVLPALRDNRSPVALNVLRWYLSESYLAGGRDDERAMRRELGTYADDAWYLETAALLAVDPFFAMRKERIVELRSRIADRNPYTTLTHPFGTSNAAFGESMRQYLLALLSTRLGEYDVADKHIQSIETAARRTHPVQVTGLIAGARAELARSRGHYTEALAALERFPFVLQPMLDLAHFGAHERMLRGDLLRALGRDQEALQWYDATPTGYDLAYMAQAHYWRAEINARLGNAGAARFHRLRFERLWRNADPERQPRLRDGLASRLVR